ncbi:MAG: hypothetical protein KC502_17500 [Myxococcales bacterium]|nr:hypothetical protein [Myxococcales bacterium]
MRVLSLFAQGAAFDYERLVTPRVSVLGGLGLRSTASGDYSGLAATLSVSARYWLHQWGPAWMHAPFGGFYAEVMLDLQRTSVFDEVDNEALPAAYTADMGLGLGYRVIVLRRVTLGLYLAQLMRTDLPGGAARTLVRSVMRYGVRVGVLF